MGDVFVTTLLALSPLQHFKWFQHANEKETQTTSYFFKLRHYLS